jgi:hypothetical protein
MSKLELLQKLDQEYGLVNLYKNGIVGASTIHHKDVYEKYDAYKRTGMNVTKAVKKAADYFDIETQSVFRIIKQFK